MLVLQGFGRFSDRKEGRLFLIDLRVPACGSSCPFVRWGCRRCLGYLGNGGLGGFDPTQVDDRETLRGEGREMPRGVIESRDRTAQLLGCLLYTSDAADDDYTV